MDNTFAELLRRHRRRSGLTQESLAELAGVSVQAVSALERGQRRHPHAYTVSQLADALGAGPVLRAEFERAARRRPQPDTATSAGPDPDWRVPRQLPSAPANFQGRGRERAAAVAALTGRSRVGTDRAAALVTIEGMGGVGKSALALEIAWAVAGDYPDGQLYLDLGGFGTGQPLSAEQAARALLAGINVPDAEIPVSLAEALGLLRTRLADRRVLVVLDNAADVRQAVALAPGTPAGAAIVTSRNAFTGVPVTARIALDVLNHGDALALFTGIVGQDRVGAEPAAAAQICDYVGRLPLAIWVAASRLMTRPNWTIGYLTDRLRDERSRLGHLTVGSLDVRATLSVSLTRAPGRSAAVAFATIGLLDRTELSPVVAGRLLGTGTEEAESVLERLAEAHLVLPTGAGRYRMHDLVHAYSRDLADEMIPAERQTLVLRNLARLYDDVAWRATELFSPGNARLRFRSEARDGVPEFADARSAFDWLDHERDGIVALVEQLHRRDPDDRDLAVLVIGLASYFIARGRFLDYLVLNRIGARAAASAPIRVMLGCDLGIAQAELGQPEEALDSFLRGADGFQVIDDPIGEALARNNASRLLDALGRPAKAIEQGERSLQLYEQAENPYGAALAMINVGASYCATGAFETGYEYFLRGYRLSARVGDDAGTARALHNLGCVQLDRGLADDAVARLTECVELTRRAGVETSLCNVLDDLGKAHLRGGSPGESVRVQEEALQVARILDDEMRIARAHHELGRAHAAADRPAAARKHLDEALAYFELHDPERADDIARLLGSPA